jgi:serine/threonine protein phosphatase PrpC
VEDKLSGTTAATVCFHGGRMTVCNAGDSRVVLGHRVPSSGDREEKKEEEKCEIEGEQNVEDEFTTREGEILPIPLTRDQTPYRKDERERVRKHGAEVMSIDQSFGREKMHDNWGDMVLGEHVDIQGDPPRVWVKGCNYPGAAFTRSLGDSIAEDVGVTADPEIITKDLTINDKFLVIASDGVFEFLTNQQVMDMCTASMNPIEACEVITKAAYDQWLHHENRTDDITIIVCFLSSTFQPSPEEESGTTEALVATANDMYGAKPIRSMFKPGATNHSTKTSIGFEAAESAPENGVCNNVKSEGIAGAAY